MISNAISTRQWQFYGHLGQGITYGGVSCMENDLGISFSYWHIATYTRDAIWLTVRTIANLMIKSYGHPFTNQKTTFGINDIIPSNSEELGSTFAT